MWSRDGEELPIEKMEAQAWICLYNLLSTREVSDSYLCNPLPAAYYAAFSMILLLLFQGDGEISPQ